MKFSRQSPKFQRAMCPPTGRLHGCIGRERNARLVGRVLSHAEHYGSYPCHRVVNHAGRLVPGWAEQRALLEAEGVTFRDAEHVNLEKHLWDCEEE